MSFLKRKILSAKHRYIDEPAAERAVKDKAYREAYTKAATRLAKYHGRKEALAAARAKYSGKKASGLLGSGLFTQFENLEGKSKKKEVKWF